MSVSSDAQSLLTEDEISRWNTALMTGVPMVVTYSFNHTRPAYDDITTAGFSRFTERHESNIRSALDAWEAVSGLTFLELESDGQIGFGMIDQSAMVTRDFIAAGFAYLPIPFVNSAGDERLLYTENSTLGAHGIAGDVFLNADLYADHAERLDPLGDSFTVLLHEIGHALGLEHPFEGDHIINPVRDNTDTSVLSYTLGNTPNQLGTADIEAIQFLYGTQAFETSFNPALKMVKQLGTSASEQMHGTELSDFLFGGAGADTLYGWSGDDFILGGSGGTADGGYGRDTVIFTSGSNSFEDRGGILGGDTFSNADLRLDDYFSGGFGNDFAHGGFGNDVLVGDRSSQFISGQDTLIGGRGSDFLQGGANSDVFRFDKFDSLNFLGASLGPDVIGRLSENQLFNALDSSRTTLTDLIARATRDFEVGIDRIEIDGLFSYQEQQLQNNFASYLEDTAEGVVLEYARLEILIIDVTEAELLSAGFTDVIHFL